MSLKITASLLAIACAVIAGCATGPTTPPPALVDGQLAQPADYKTWPKFLSNIQRPEVKQVREIYMNKVASTAVRGQPFPQGSQFVMENYAAVANPDGTLQKGADGNLVKGNLVAVFVMGKNPGWGQNVAPELRTGNWIFAGYKPTGDKVDADPVSCRGCHIAATPDGTKGAGPARDWVIRYDQYFDQKKAGLTTEAVMASLSAAHGGMSAQDLHSVSALQR